MKFRKKPVVIDAHQFTEDSKHSVALWCSANLVTGNFPSFMGIKTLEGTMRAEINDWIIRGVNGEFYPCKPDIFEKTYEKVEIE